MNTDQFHCFISALATVFVLMKAFELSMMLKYASESE